MSGWLLMGLPGLAYWCGIADAAWTAIGLAVGTYINWLIVSKRRAGTACGQATPSPSQNTFPTASTKGQSHYDHRCAVHPDLLHGVRTSCLVTCGKLFSTLFDMPYIPMMIVGAVFVLVYTLIGGFLAESASDFMQALVMIIALGVIVFVGTTAARGAGRGH